MRPTIAVALVALLLAVLAAGESPAPGASFPGANGRIAYASNQSGNWDIYSMSPDGSGKKQITSGPGNDTQPSYSADGRRIVFSSNRAGSYDVYTMNADGSEITRLTTDPSGDVQPSFSPDGTHIAFVSTRFGSWYTDLYVMNADGGEQTRIVSAGGIEESPTFSPDGQRIAFARTRDTHKNIFTVGIAGEGLAAVRNSATDDRQPSFSPNGQQIAFSSRHDGHFEIYTMNSNGTGMTKLTSKPASQMPAYSPSGAQIAFSRGGSIYAIDARGGGEVRLTNERGAQAWPSWQPLSGAPTGPPGGGSASMRIGKPILDRRHGTAKLPVTVPGAGTLALHGNGVKRLAAKTVAGATTVKLRVKPTPGTAKALKQKLKAKVKVLVTYLPKGGGAETKAKTFKLYKKR
jgi:Tol biopolymer transport system component